jgi:hypothetical protein
MTLLGLAIAILFMWLARRQAAKAYRAALSVVRPIKPKTRPIGPERERIPEWK